MRFHKKNALLFISIFLLKNPTIHGLLLPEHDKNIYIEKVESVLKFYKKMFSEFINNTTYDKEEELRKKEEEYEKRFSTWSYTRSLKYLENNKEYQELIHQQSSSNIKKGKTNKKKNNYEEHNKYKRYALNPESLMKGFPKYVSEDIAEANKKRSSKRQFDDPILTELYQNETQYFTEENFNNYPKNISLEHNIVKVSIPFRNKEDQKIKRFLIRGNELLNSDSLKDAKTFPLIDYDYEDYIKNKELNKVRYLKKKVKNSLEEPINSRTSRADNEKKKEQTMDYSDDDKSFIFYYFCDDENSICEKALKVFESAGERFVKLINFKYSIFVYIYYYSFCNHNSNCHSTVMGSAAPSYFYVIKDNKDEDENKSYYTRSESGDEESEKISKVKKEETSKTNKIQQKNNEKTKLEKRSDHYDMYTFSNTTGIFNTPYFSYKNAEGLTQHYSQYSTLNDNTKDNDSNDSVSKDSSKDQPKSTKQVHRKARQQEVVDVENTEDLDSDYSYPSALMKQLTGIETESDIMVLFNSDFSWDYDGSEKGKKYNLEQTVLHELLHGLGFLSSWYNWFDNTDDILLPADITLSPTSGDYGVMEKPYIFNKYIANHIDGEWISSYQKKIVEDFKHFPEYPFKSHLYKYFKDSASYDVARKVHKIMTTPESVTFWCAAPYNLTSSLQMSQSLVRPTLKKKYFNSNKKINKNKRFKMAKTSKKKPVSTIPVETSDIIQDDIENNSENITEIDDYREIENQEQELQQEEVNMWKSSKLYVNWLVLYTPPTYLTGTSLSHFDSQRYRKTKNYIMRPYMDSSTSISYSEEQFNNSYGISDDILCVLRTLGYTLFTDEGLLD
ncbi:hypothetical protein BCR36DRAFT_408287 [Piromyces finnis]|uniref:Uncharacterized protein n=1 Tax=Piromyces finnis TaxID=1754191 RepID=A0A1Y1VLV6_9FUNG|nr:hypothetical protein BCR36DRAFT_408287 [Piromyces finnis]|eukprot:ORX59916.1 hypothetical protein BCR36DRAFT_408287 [Piromyces finnis]